MSAVIFRNRPETGCRVQLYGQRMLYGDDAGRAEQGMEFVRIRVPDMLWGCIFCQCIQDIGGLAALDMAAAGGKLLCGYHMLSSFMKLRQFLYFSTHEIRSRHNFLRCRMPWYSQ